MRVLIAPDKFKGSLTAAEVGAALAAGWAAGWPSGREILEIETLPIADGGEGTSQVIHHALHGTWVTLTVTDPLGRPVQAKYTRVVSAGERVAVLEMSSASGYLLVRDTDRDLLRTNTFGTGEMLRHAMTSDPADRIILGIGGSATNDGGIGLAAALGYRFFDAAGALLPALPENLTRLARFEVPDSLPLIPIRVACDVVNPLLGPTGATRVYGPQKGLRGDEEAVVLEAALHRLADVAAQTFGRDYRDTPGAGAAGGLGFGLLTFCGAELCPGFDLVAGLLGLPAAVSRADIVLTGEGSLDSQTLEGKGPFGVAALARRSGKPVVAFGGRAEAAARGGLASCFDEIIALVDAEPVLAPADCIARAAELLYRHAGKLAARVAARRAG